MSDELTIDELAQRVGSRTSTVRMYQSKGLLPGPEIRGRIGYYNSAHLARLRVIGRLQERGFSLAAIKDLLENWSRGASIAALVGEEQDLAAFGESTEMSPADFAALFPDGHVDPDVVRRAIGLGLLSFDPERGMVKAPSKAFVEIGRELAAHRIPPARAMTEFEELAADVRRIAQRFNVFFEEFVAEGSHDDLPAVERRFHRMAASAVQELLAQALRDAAAASGRHPGETPPS
ncbi:MerR family transcriptional regulator [Dactylosporangium maewongense]|uniref:MerR family transcriptional regulator n=1 Tax=Dactylosporangium maewongense TaxID=634393 RepID=UPI0031D6D7E9